MERVNLFLTRFAGLLPPEARVKEVISLALKEELGLDLSPAMVEVRGRRVYLRASPLIKNLIFINRERVVALITRRLGESQPRRLS